MDSGKQPAGDLIFDLHTTYRSGGRTGAFIRRPGDIVPVGVIMLGVEGMPEDRNTGRTMVAGFNSYKRHALDPVGAAEADLLGKLIEASREFLAAHEAWLGAQKAHEDAGGVNQPRVTYVTSFDAVMSAARRHDLACASVRALLAQVRP